MRVICHFGEANIEGHFFCRLAKHVIERTIGCQGTVLHTDDPAT